MNKNDLVKQLEELKAQFDANTAEYKKVLERQQNDIAELEKRLETLSDELPEDVHDVPLFLGEKELVSTGKVYRGYTVIMDGTVCEWCLADLNKMPPERKKRRVFPEERFAEMFAEKTQFIANCLHFKWLYDRDYVPDFEDVEQPKYFVYYHSKELKYLSSVSYIGNYKSTYFSSEKIAEKCAKWLNMLAEENSDEERT